MTRSLSRALLAALPLALLAACDGDSISGPEQNARRMAARFDFVGDSLAAAGDADAAEGAHGLAEVLRMSDRLNTVTVSLDGAARAYNALLLQLQLPESGCLAGEDCEAAPTFVQVVVGWRGQDVSDGFVFVMDTVGTHGVVAPSPDGTNGARVLGGLFERRTERAWLATGGSVRTARARVIDGCGESQRFPVGLGVDCRVGVVTFHADVRLDEASAEGGVMAGARRTLLIDGQSVAGLALELGELPDAARPRLAPRRILSLFAR